jgi:hypothetical protein
MLEPYVFFFARRRSPRRMWPHIIFIPCTNRRRPPAVQSVLLSRLYSCIFIFASPETLEASQCICESRGAGANRLARQKKRVQTVVAGRGPLRERPVRARHRSSLLEMRSLLENITPKSDCASNFQLNALLLGAYRGKFGWA